MTGPTTNTRFVYDGDRLALEYDANGAISWRYYFGPNVDEPILADPGGSLACSNGTRFLHHNHQGSIVALADCWGNRQTVNSYDEYGIPGASNQGRFQYTGQAWLPELGMYHYKARIYSPTLGRFLQVDPIGYDDQINLYAYVGNDPVNKVDPSGLAGELKQGAPTQGAKIEWECSTGSKSGKRSILCTPGVGIPVQGGSKKKDPRTGGKSGSVLLDPKGPKPLTPLQRAEKIANEELARTRRIAPGGAGHNDIFDAERHARWIYRVATEVDPLTAYAVAEGHEWAGALLRDQPMNEYVMDMNNNMVGLKAYLNDNPIPNLSTPGLVTLSNGSDGY